MNDLRNKPQRSPSAVWQELLDSGDIQSLMNAFHTNREACTSPEWHLQEILNIVQNKAIHDIDGLIDQMFRQAIAATSCMLLRVQLNIEKSINRPPMCGDMNVHTIDNAQSQLDQWEAQVDYLMRLTARYASIRHTLSLSQAASQNTTNTGKNADIKLQSDNIEASESSPVSIRSQNAISA